MSVKSEHDSDTRAYQTSCQSYYTDIFAGIGRTRVRFADRAAKKSGCTPGETSQDVQPHGIKML
jgi:hypothetical protein